MTALTIAFLFLLGAFVLLCVEEFERRADEWNDR